VSAKRTKQPGREVTPNPQKVPRGGGKAESYDQEPFRWRTVKVDCDGPFGWGNAAPDLLFRHIIPKLHEFETMYWHQLRGGTAGHHECEVTGMCKEARDRLVRLGLDEYDTLFSLRLTGRQRVWGIRDRGILHLLWWDPDHAVYPSTKKNT
jgi:hypothetical protein